MVRCSLSVLTVRVPVAKWCLLSDGCVYCALVSYRAALSPDVRLFTSNPYWHSRFVCTAGVDAASIQRHGLRER